MSGGCSRSSPLSRRKLATDDRETLTLFAIRRQVPSTKDANRSSSRTLPARRLSNVINKTSWTRSSAAAGSRRCRRP